MDARLNLADALRNLASQIREILRSAAEKLADGGVEEFVNKKIGCLAQLIECFREVLQSVGVAKRSELDELVRRSNAAPGVREAAEAVYDAENEWTAFVEGVDARLAEATSGGGCSQTNRTVSAAQPGCLGPVHVPLIDARWRDKMLPIILTFGDIKGARLWLAETGCPYDMLVDSERQIYKFFGLRQSVSMVWNVPTLTFYGEQKRNGRALPKAYADISDDPHQMGGDVIIDATTCKVVMIYRSQNPTDRPSVDYLLTKMV